MRDPRISSRGRCNESTVQPSLAVCPSLGWMLGPQRLVGQASPREIVGRGHGSPVST